MQFKINTITRTIELEDEVGIRELLNTLKSLGLDKEEWSIKVSKQIQYIPYYNQPYYVDLWHTYEPNKWPTYLSHPGVTLTTNTTASGLFTNVTT